uniref:Uncharacterized protein n=1 Tax=Rhizophora mucronata TaxID=61149 RepID=A0A2P2JGV2_RHIMU
MQMFCCYEIG